MTWQDGDLGAYLERLGVPGIVDVPVHFINEEKSKGIKLGGVLNVVRHAVELYVAADKIPDFIEVDLAGTEIRICD